MSARKGKGGKKPQNPPKKPTKQPETPKTTREFFLRPAIFSVLWVIAGIAVWMICSSIGQSMTDDNIRGVAQVVKIPSCLNKYTWKDEECPNKQPGDYTGTGDWWGGFWFFICLSLAVIKMGRATYRWIMAA